MAIANNSYLESFGDMLMKANPHNLTEAQKDRLKQTIDELGCIFMNNFKGKISITSPNPDFEKIARKCLETKGDEIIIAMNILLKLTK